MDNIPSQRTTNNISVFNNSFLSAKNLYMHYFGKLPNIHYIGVIDGEKTYKAFRENQVGTIKEVLQYHWYKHEKKEYQFYTTIVVLEQNFLIEFDEDYCYLLHDGNQDGLVKEITAIAKKFKERQKRQPLEINLVVRTDNGLKLQEMEIKRTKLDIDLYYEDDLKPVDAIIRSRLSKKKDKGIVLLHGLPGTGKTTYLRYLVGRLKKRILFLSPGVAANLMNPDFLQLLISNPDTVLIIEDAENIIMDRRHNSDSSVSNLLNISDGLLSDCLNVQMICTFNSSITLIDQALMRKGRLIARYEFGKLGISKAERLSKHFGFNKEIKEPMTVAEIANQHEAAMPIPTVQVLGFRRNPVLEN